jgi:hypothetical protein
MTTVQGSTLPVKASETYRDTWSDFYNAAFVAVSAACKKYATFSFPSTESMATGNDQAEIIIPSGFNGYNLTAVYASVVTAGTTGTCDIQIYNKTDSQDMLSTKLTIDSAETRSTTAATPAVINTTYDDVATGDVLQLDIDAVHTTPAKGLVVVLEFSYPD